MKTCGKCREAKPLNQFSVDKSRRDGLQPKCKACNRAYHYANRDRILERQRVYEKTHPHRVKEKRRRVYAANAEKRKAEANAWYYANRDKALQQQKAWRDANAQKKREADRAYRQANQDKIREREKANPEKGRRAMHRRRARMSAVVPQRWQIHDIVPFCCYWCGANLRAYGAASHVDHVMPISLGGPAVPSNEVATCASCNLRKQAKHPLVWIAELVA